MSFSSRGDARERCLYDALIHAERADDGDASEDDDVDASTTTSMNVFNALARALKRRRHSREGDDEVEFEEDERKRSSLASTSTSDGEAAVSVVAHARNVFVFRGNDDFHNARGGCSKARIQSISWSADGLAFVIVQPSMLSVATRVGEVVCEFEAKSAVAFATLASLKNDDAYDLISVNLGRTPTLLTRRVSLTRGARAGELVSRTLGKALTSVDAASWIEVIRTLVVVGQSKSSTAVTTWKYFDGADKSEAALMLMKSIDCGVVLTPRRLLFSSPRVSRLSVFHDDDSLNVAITSPVGELSVVQIRKNGEFSTKVKIKHGVRAVAWWSQTALAIASRKGEVVVEDVSSGANLLGDAPESFESIADIVSLPKFVDGAAPRARVLLLERPSLGGWKLISLNERSANEMLQSHMDLEEWGSALILARQHGLDTDQVYKSRWLRSPIPTIEGLTDWLSRISDRPWVVVQCLTACATTYEIQRHILVYGLKETDSQARKVHNSTVTEPDWSWWVKVRIALLGALDRADTVYAACGGAFSCTMYEELRQSTIEEAALNAAYASDVKLLLMIFKRHANGVTPIVFDVLAALPEALKVSTYERLLPWSVDYVLDLNASVAGRRSKDWAESECYLRETDNEEEMDRALARQANVSDSVADAFSRAVSSKWLKSATEELCRLRQQSVRFNKPLTALDMEVWAIQRACEMDSAAGALGSARQILQSAARSLQSETLIDYAFAASILEVAMTIVFEIDARVGVVSLEEFVAGGSFERLSMLLALVSESNAMRLMSKPVRNFMSHMSNVSSESTSEILQRWILTTSENRQLRLVSSVVSWLSSSDETLALVGGAEALAAVVAEASLCQTDADEQSTGELAEMLNSLPSCVADVSVAKTAILRLNACRAMQTMGFKVSLADVTSAERNESRAIELIRAYVEAFLKAAEHETVDWSALWFELHRFQTGVFHRCLTHEQVLTVLVRTQLQRKDFLQAKRHIPVAGAVGAIVGGLKELGGSISSVLSASSAEQVIFAISEEFMNQATNVDDARFGDAEKCLRLMPLKTAIASRLEFISALRSLASFGVNRAPKEINGKVALEMVLECLDRHPESYRSPDDLQAIASRLGLTESRDQLAILLATGVKALECGDVMAASATSNRLAKRDYAPSWKLCAEVARALPLGSSNEGTRVSLLAFALSHADEDVLSHILSDWQTAQARQNLQKVSTEIENQSSVQLNVDDVLSRAADHSTSNMRPAIKLLASNPLFCKALAMIFNSEKEKAKAAASAIAYALGIYGSDVSDEVLAKIATQSIDDATRCAEKSDFGSETPPPSMWSSIAVLLVMRDSGKVSKVIDDVARDIQERSVLQAVLNLGTCVHALRALRSNWDSIRLPSPVTTSSLLELVSRIKKSDDINDDVSFMKHFSSSLGSVVDAEWLSDMIPEVDAGAFTADGTGYRKRAIMALAAGSSSALSSEEALDHALRLADTYDIDPYDVFTAHSAVLATADDTKDVQRVAKVLKEAFATRPGKSLDTMKTSVWKRLPSRGPQAIESITAYFDVLSVCICDAASVEHLNAVTAALKSIAAASVDIDLKVFVGADGAVLNTTSEEARKAIQNAAIAEAARGKCYPRDMVQKIFVALDTLPSKIPGLDRREVHFAIVQSMLSPPSGASRPSPEKRWKAVNGALDEIGDSHLMEIAKCVSAREVTSGGSEDLNIFASESSVRMRLVVLDSVLGKLDASAPAMSEVLEARNIFRFIDGVSRDMPGLDADLVRILDESLRKRLTLQVVAALWVRQAATFSQITSLANIAGSSEPKHVVDVNYVITNALREALEQAETQPLGFDSIIRKTLGSERSAPDHALAAVRSNAFVIIQENVANAPVAARARILELLSELASEKNSIWPGWAPAGDADGMLHILSMRTGALLAPYGLSSPKEKDVRDAEAMRSYFSNTILTDPAIQTVPFSVFAQVLSVWEDFTRSKAALKPCWVELLSHRLGSGEAMDIFAEQALASKTSARFLSDEDLAHVLESTKSKTSSDVDALTVTKLSLLLGKPIDDNVCVWDADAAMLAILKNRVSEFIAKSPNMYDEIVELAIKHERGGDVLIPHIIASLTRAKAYALAAALATRMTTTLEAWRDDFEMRLAILRRQLRANAERRDMASDSIAIRSPRLGDRVLEKLVASVRTASASALAALELALS